MTSEIRAARILAAAQLTGAIFGRYPPGSDESPEGNVNQAINTFRELYNGIREVTPKEPDED